MEREREREAVLEMRAFTIITHPLQQGERGRDGGGREGRKKVKREGMKEGDGNTVGGGGQEPCE